MKKKSFVKRMRVVFASLLIAVVLLGVVASPSLRFPVTKPRTSNSSAMTSR